jgi:hypothetical protein
MPFQFAIGQRVKVRATGELGVVERNDTESTFNSRYCVVRLDDGRAVRKAESDLIEA